jgi:hypothetical protein
VSRDLWLAVFVGDGLAREVELSFEEFGATGQAKNLRFLQSEHDLDEKLSVAGRTDMAVARV